MTILKITAGILLAVVVLSACGDGGDVTESPPAAEPTTAGKTACAAFAGVASTRCEHSYTVCSVVTPAAVAEEWGGDPAIPEDVARVYGESYIPAARLGGAVGCEAGFASQDEAG